MTRFIHTADWQLGMAAAFLDEEARPRFSQARIDAIATIGALAVSEGCAFVVVCGDVFETNQVNRQTVLRALEAMKKTPEVTFYLLPGNHDPLDPSSVFRSRTFTDNCPAHVVVLDTPGTLPISDGVELVAAPWFSKRPLTDLVAEVIRELPADGTVRIVVGHGAIDTLSPDKANPVLISLAPAEAAIGEGKVHYIALGDRHSRTDVGNTGRIWYSGAPEPTAYVEVDPGFVLIVDVDADRVEVTERITATWKFEVLEADLTSRADIDELGRRLDNFHSKDRSIVKLALVGQLSLADKAYFDNLRGDRKQLFAVLDDWERRTDLVVRPDEADVESLGLSGFAREAFEKIGEIAQSDGDEAVVARDALALCYRLAGGGS
ncbi:MAG: exonuclease SbcCD subunit D [Acidimicrobiia bacterium]|nr:exonuclease SbcCD subunit D [Acidimicrobiia bacterium]